MKNNKLLHIVLVVLKDEMSKTILILVLYYHNYPNSE